MKRNRAQIQADALTILADSPGGIRWSELLRRTHDDDPDTPFNSVHGGIHNLLRNNGDITKVDRGIYRLRRFEVQSDPSEQVDRSGELVELELPDHEKVRVRERDFYDSFATWLVEDADEVNAAVTIGGALLKGKWGTPDVIGVYKPRAHDLLKFEPQIVSAEIKVDPHQPVTAFGQAVAYRLFSHKSYIVVPNSTNDDDLARLKALCTVNGVGLVTFTPDVEKPAYVTVVPPTPATPDMFYANQMIRRLLEADRAAFESLF